MIARGGMATVYEATDTRLDRDVAVKVMHRSLAEDPQFVERFTREARAAAKVAGPEVVAVHDTGTDPETGLAYLVMEHVRGQNFRQLLLSAGPFSPSRAVALMEPVLKALASAHAMGMVHRDVKPENVLHGNDGRVKVADFGLARAVESTAITQTVSHVIGSIAYLAPEQVERGTADARSDVYAAGVVLFELLTGAPPHHRETVVSLMNAVANEDVPPPSTVVAGIPPELDALVVRATRRDPGSRPVDAGEFLRELQQVKATLPAAGPMPVSVQEWNDTRTLVVPRVVERTPVRAAGPRKSRRGLIATLVLLALALVAAFGGYYLGSFRYTHAPDLTNLSAPQAKDRVEKAGLEFKRVDEFSETVDANKLIRQDPPAGERVKKSSTVTAVYSKGKDRRPIPDLKGQDPSAATTTLKGRGIDVASQPLEYSSSVQEGKVTRTDPPAGTRVKPGTKVKLYVSKGPQPIPVPNLAGKSQGEATSQLQGLGFKVAVTTSYSDDVDKGVVISNDPNSGTAAKGSTVTLTVSKGPEFVNVPDLRYDTTADATRQLKALGLGVAVKTRVQGGNGQLVLDTDPKAGKRVHVGTTVTLLVY